VPSNNADPIVHQVTEIADYEALREVANQLAGLLVARQRTTTSDEEARAWRLEHRALRARLDDIQPHTPAVTEALTEWSDRLAQLREDAT
jgi:hypothetical protein